MKKTNGKQVIQVEKGIPMPSLRQDIGLDKALEAMEVGDSFRIAKGHYASVRSMASMRKYSIRTRAEDATHIRVWRVA